MATYTHKLKDHPSSTLAGLNGVLSDATLPNFAGQADQVVYVATTGSDVIGDGTFGNPYASINNAVGTITDSSFAKRYVVMIMAGVYTEVAITLPDFVSLVGVTQGAVTINPIVTTGTIITLGNSTGVSNVLIGGATAGKGIVKTGVGLNIIQDVLVADCLTGIEINNAAANVSIINLGCIMLDAAAVGLNILAGNVVAKLLNFPDAVGGLGDKAINITGANSNIEIIGMTLITGGIDFGLYMSTAATAELFASSVEGESGDRITTGVYATGTDTHVHVHGCTLKHFATAIVLDDGARGEITGCVVEKGAKGIEIGSTENLTTMQLMGTAVYNIDTGGLDVDVLASDSISIGVGNIFTDEKLQVATGAVFNVTHYDTTEGDEGMRIKGELGVGTSENPSESSFGEGDSTSRGILLYQYDSVGTQFIDKSAEAKSISGSEFSWFANVAGDCIYLSTDRKNPAGGRSIFYGNKITMGTTALVIGAGELITEIWNGTAWVAFNQSLTESNSPYYPVSVGTALTTASGSFQGRHDPNNVDVWQTKTNGGTEIAPNTGVDDVPYVGADEARYWLRYRIVTAVTTLPTFEQLKPHTSRMEINSDGWPEFFGNARPVLKLPISVASLVAFEGSMAQETVYLDENIAINLPDGKFTTSGDKTGAMFELPVALDVSGGLRVRMSFMPIVTATDYALTVRCTKVEPNQVMYLTEPTASANLQEIVLTNLSWTAGEKTIVEVDFDISDYLTRRENGNGDQIAISIESTTGNDFVIVDLAIGGVAWCSGGHLE